MDAAIKKTKKLDRVLAREIRDNSREAFKQLFFRYHKDLCSVAAQITKCTDRARDVVQEVFLRLWRNRQSWQINSSVKAYLYRAVWNEALNAKEQQKRRRELKQEFFHLPSENDPVLYDISDKSGKLIKEIWQVVSEMPERRRFVFTLHRKEGLSYKEISRVMDITRKTVENHMGLALKEIRESIDPTLFE